MKLIAGDFIRGAIAPIRKGISASSEKFDDAVMTGADTFYKKGILEWEKFTKEGEKARDKVKLLMSLGVKNKDVAISLAGQDDEAFNNMVTNFRAAQEKTQSILTLRDHVRAKNVPSEEGLAGDVATMGGEGQYENRVIEDLTNENINEVVSGIIGTVEPGTLSENQEAGFVDALKGDYLRMGFGDTGGRGALIRERALAEAGAQRPAGVSEEDWLGFMRAKIKPGEASGVTFGAPFSRAAERAEQVAELGAETAVLTLQKLQNEIRDIKNLEKPITSILDPNNPATKKMLAALGVSIPEGMTIRQFNQQASKVGWIVNAYDTLMKNQYTGLGRTDISAIRRETSRRLVGYFGRGLEFHPATGDVQLTTGEELEQSQLAAVHRMTLGAAIVANEVSRATNGDFSATDTLKDEYIATYGAKHALDEVKNAKGGVDLEKQVLESTDPPEEVKMIMAKLRGRVTDYPKNVVGLLSLQSIGEIETYLKRIAANGDKAILGSGTIGIAQFLASQGITFKQRDAYISPEQAGTVSISTDASVIDQGVGTTTNPLAAIDANAEQNALEELDPPPPVRGLQLGDTSNMELSNLIAEAVTEGKDLYDILEIAGIKDRHTQNFIVKTLEDNLGLVNKQILKGDNKSAPLATRIMDIFEPYYTTKAPTTSTVTVKPSLTELGSSGQVNNEPKKQNGLMAKKTDVFNSTITGMLKDMGISLTRKTPTLSDEKQLNITDRGKKQLLDITERGRAGLIKIMESTDLTNLPKNIAEQRIKTMLYKIVNARTKGNLRRYDEVNLQDTIKALTEVLYDQVAQGKGT